MWIPSDCFDVLFVGGFGLAGSALSAVHFVVSVRGILIHAHSDAASLAYTPALVSFGDGL
jgi:hypothetical protein